MFTFDRRLLLGATRVTIHCQLDYTDRKDTIDYLWEISILARLERCISASILCVYESHGGPQPVLSLVKLIFFEASVCPVQ